MRQCGTAHLYGAPSCWLEQGRGEEAPACSPQIVGNASNPNLSDMRIQSVHDAWMRST